MADDLAQLARRRAAQPARELSDLGRARRARAAGCRRRRPSSRDGRRCASSTSAAASSRTTRSSRASPPSTSASTSSRTRPPSCSARSRRCPSRTRSFDVVLCTQVLEHCDDPAQAVRELRRVTAPGGRVLASTHGVQVYHPSPVDYWRWTHEGLRRLFEQNADWSTLSRRARRGHRLGARDAARHVRRDRAAAHRARAAARLAAQHGRRGARRAQRDACASPVPGSLIPNLHVVATP